MRTPWMNRRQFIQSSTAAITASAMEGMATAEAAIELPAAHREAMRLRRRRIIVQYDANDTMWSYWKLNRSGDTSFNRFRDVVFTFADEPGSQIDAIWWDIGGSPLGSSYPSKVEPPVDHPLLQQWLRDGVDWVGQLVKESRRRKLEVFWNHRVSEVECLPEGGLSKQPHPLKVQHPDWVAAASWWPQGMWNLAAAGLREHKVAILRELATQYDFDGFQIDFSRHVPCLPVGRQWELRGEVTEFMRMVRTMLLDVAIKRGRPILLSAKVPQTLAGCHADGFDVKTWSEQHLVDMLTLGSRSMDVDVEGIRSAVGKEVQLQPCFDDHHAPDGYRNQSMEFLRGVFANHWQRGADSVVTFNWSVGPPSVDAVIGEQHGANHEAAYHEVGEPRTLAGKDKVFAVERRGGYPWADGFFNRNDTAPLPTSLSKDSKAANLILHISDAPDAAKNRLTLRCVVFHPERDDAVEVRINGVALASPRCDPEWKDAQVFSPKSQPTSGGTGLYVINPKQRLLRVDFEVPSEVWKQGANVLELRARADIQLEKVEGHLAYH